jgi:hypothetical protein
MVGISWVLVLSGFTVGFVPRVGPAVYQDDERGSAISTKETAVLVVGESASNRE